MDRSARPAMSVVLSSPDTFQTIQATWRHLRAQSSAHQLEIVIVAPSAARLGAVPDDGFWGVRVIETGSLRSVGAANAAGVRSARAPVVALAEDHSFPEPGWADALIRAHREPWAAVGPGVGNANPSSRVSRADFLIAYGRWAEPAAARIENHLPGHNSSYKRDLLLAYGEQLETLLEAETVLHWDLCHRGHQLYLESAARTRHLNFARLGVWLRVQFLSGRMFAATRAGPWSAPRRALFAAATPLIPAVRLWRILRLVGRRRPAGFAPDLVPVLLLGLVLDGAGQLAGCVAGPGGARERLVRYEHHRVRYAH